MKTRLLGRLRRRYRIAYSKLEKVTETDGGRDLTDHKYVIYDSTVNTHLYLMSKGRAIEVRRNLILRDILKMRHDRDATKIFLDI